MKTLGLLLLLVLAVLSLGESFYLKYFVHIYRVSSENIPLFAWIRLKSTVFTQLVSIFLNAHIFNLKVWY